jgi:hypothetical protein
MPTRYGNPASGSTLACDRDQRYSDGMKPVLNDISFRVANTLPRDFRRPNGARVLGQLVHEVVDSVYVIAQVRDMLEDRLRQP